MGRCVGTAGIMARQHGEIRARASIGALFLFVLAALTACGDSSRGYHVSSGKVYFVHGFPPERTEVSGADAGSFESLTGDYARDKNHVYYDGQVMTGDRARVWLEGKPVSEDPAGFELLDGDMAKDSKAVYCGDGSVVSNDPTHFAIVLVNGGTIPVFTKDSRTVYYDGKPIAGADPATFQLLYAGDSCAADERHAYHGDTVIPNADPRSFPPGRRVTGCSDTAITFAH
jgi:hypothetical protein